MKLLLALALTAAMYGCLWGYTASHPALWLHSFFVVFAFGRACWLTNALVAPCRHMAKAPHGDEA